MPATRNCTFIQPPQPYDSPPGEENSSHIFSAASRTSSVASIETKSAVSLARSRKVSPEHRLATPQPTEPLVAAAKAQAPSANAPTVVKLATSRPTKSAYTTGREKTLPRLSLASFLLRTLPHSLPQPSTLQRLKHLGKEERGHLKPLPRSLPQLRSWLLLQPTWPPTPPLPPRIPQ